MNFTSRLASAFVLAAAALSAGCASSADGDSASSAAESAAVQCFEGQHPFNGTGVVWNVVRDSDAQVTLQEFGVLFWHGMPLPNDDGPDAPVPDETWTLHAVDGSAGVFAGPDSVGLHPATLTLDGVKAVLTINSGAPEQLGGSSGACF